MDKTDVELRVNCEIGTGVTLSYELSASDWELDLYRRGFGPVRLQAEPWDYFQRFLDELAGLPVETEEERWNSERRLQARGEKLSRELLPGDLRGELRDLVGRTETLWIVSDEPWIPWEFLCLSGGSGSEARRETFLGEAFAISRWRRRTPPTRHLPLAEIALVVARDAHLPMAAEEERVILGLAGDGRDVTQVPARYRDILEAMEGGEYDGWHFVCHGSASGRGSSPWGLTLSDFERLTPDDLTLAVPGLREAHPLVFLNACQSARGGFSLAHLGGWADFFVTAGAGAFVGPMWSVRDSRARSFAQNFYRHLCGGTGIAEAARRTRTELREELRGDPNRLAYAVFAWPHASVVPPGDDTSHAGPGREVPEEALAAGNETGAPEPDPAASGAEGPELHEPAPSPPASGGEYLHERDGSAFVFVPGGTYTLGADISEVTQPVHRVRLSPFWIAKHPVTNEQYGRFLEQDPRHPEPEHWRSEHFAGPRKPVVGVSWHDALAYCRWAGLLLPSEAQWEAAARGGDGRRYPWGFTLPTERHASFGGRSPGPAEVDAHPEGRGPFGTLGQGGNVWEWCADAWSRTAYADRYDGILDPSVDRDLAVRVVRGGSWQNPARDMRAAYRDFATAKMRYPDLGFRCVLPARDVG